MPRNFIVDLHIGKKFLLREPFSFEVFGEAFNLFNHINVASVGKTIYIIRSSPAACPTAGAGPVAPTLCGNPLDTGFGAPTSSVTSTGFLTQRQVQIGVRLTF